LLLDNFPPICCSYSASINFAASKVARVLPEREEEARCLEPTTSIDASKTMIAIAITTSMRVKALRRTGTRHFTGVGSTV